MKHTLILSTNAWHNLQEKILEDYGRATLLISWRLKATLGFSVREHTWYDHVDGFLDRFTDIRLDFYDEQLQTLFLLKYGEFITAHDYDQA
jgi:hypothetical protein